MADERSIDGSRAPRKEERTVSGESRPEETRIDYALRPRSLNEMIGQERLRDKMRILVEAARQRDEALDHVLLYGPPGLGKCISADSLILTQDGPVPFSELIELHLPDGPPEPGAYRPLLLQICGRSGLETASHVYANGPGPTRRLQTSAGFALEGTPNHPVLIATDDGPSWRRLDEIQPDSFIAVARGTRISRSTTSVRDFARSLRVRTKAVVERRAESIDPWEAPTCADEYPLSLESPPLLQDEAALMQTQLADFGIVAYRYVDDSGCLRLCISETDQACLLQDRSHELPGDSANVSRDDDPIPYAGDLVRRLYREAGLDIPAPVDAQESTGTLERGLVEAALERLPLYMAFRSEFRALALLLDPYIFWDPVSTILRSEGETFDFVVPGTHSFVANGLYNHNTTLSHILANEMSGNLKPTAGPAIEKAGDLAAILTNLRKGDILFIDEIHRLGRAVEEILYPAMEDFVLDITVGSGPSARSIRLKLPRFTVIGATTRLALITSPLRARFGVVERFDFYGQEALVEILHRAAALLELPIDAEGAVEIARRSRGTPRVALRLLRRVRDYAQVRAEGAVTREVADEALAIHEIDHLGLDDIDRRVLDAIINKFDGGPVGLETMAASISEESDTIMDVVEPYLLQLGFLDRTPRGRVATRAAYDHMGVLYPDDPEQGTLFSRS